MDGGQIWANQIKFLSRAWMRVVFDDYQLLRAHEADYHKNTPKRILEQLALQAKNRFRGIRLRACNMAASR